MPSSEKIEQSLTTRQGKPIRLITIYEPERVTELFYQQFGGTWVPYKRVVLTIH
ncbi:hypothetical protein [Marinobacter sp.]|uniref:hypothetical protein n=1 Tax=Marinobacter sp. TaxID=50741 RepID=UPI003A94A2EB